MKLDPVPSATAETVGPTESGCVSVSDEAHDTRNISSPFPPPSDAPTVHHSLEQLNGTSGRSDDAATSSVGSMIGSTSARSAAPGPSQAADVQPPSCETPLVGGEVEEVLEEKKIKKELAELVPKVEQSAGEGGAQAGGLAAQHGTDSRASEVALLLGLLSGATPNNDKSGGKEKRRNNTSTNQPLFSPPLPFPRPFPMLNNSMPYPMPYPMPFGAPMMSPVGPMFMGGGMMMAGAPPPRFLGGGGAEEGIDRLETSTSCFSPGCKCCPTFQTHGHAPCKCARPYASTLPTSPAHMRACPSTSEVNMRVELLVVPGHIFL